MTYSVLFGNKLNVKEKIFIALSWLPKATVQVCLLYLVSCQLCALCCIYIGLLFTFHSYLQQLLISFLFALILKIIQIICFYLFAIPVILLLFFLCFIFILL